MEPPATQAIARAPQPWGMAKAIADILAALEETFAVDAQQVHRSMDLLKATCKTHSDVVIRQVKNLCDQLGHPSNAKLANALRLASSGSTRSGPGWSQTARHEASTTWST